MPARKKVPPGDKADARLAPGGTAPIAQAGHNSTPFDMFDMALGDVYATAKDFLDGAAIETQGQADVVGLVISEAKKLRRDIDAARADEKRPHDEAAKAVQVKWKPLLDRCDTIERAAKAPLSAWLNQLAEEQREAERLAREEAMRLQQAAIEAERAAQGIAGQEAAKEAQALADDAAKAANRASKAKAQVAGTDRALGLRTYWTAKVTNNAELLRWIRENDPQPLRDFLADYARKAVVNGAKWLPGVTIETERRVA